MQFIRFAKRSIAVLATTGVVLTGCTMLIGTTSDLTNVPNETATAVVTATSMPGAGDTPATMTPVGMPEQTDEQQVILQTVTDHLMAEGTDVAAFTLELDRIDGDYVRVTLQPKGAGDPHLAYLQRNGAGWEVIASGNLFDFALHPARLGQIGIPDSLWGDLITPGPLPTDPTQPGDAEQIDTVVRNYVAEQGGLGLGNFTVQVDGIELDYARATIIRSEPSEPGLVFLRRIADAWDVILLTSPLEVSVDPTPLVELGVPESLWSDLVMTQPGDAEQIDTVVRNYVAEQGGLGLGDFTVQVDGIELDYARATIIRSEPSEPALVFLQRIADAWDVILLTSPLEVSVDPTPLVELGVPESLWSEFAAGH